MDRVVLFYYVYLEKWKLRNVRVFFKEWMKNKFKESEWERKKLCNKCVYNKNTENGFGKYIHSRFPAVNEWKDVWKLQLNI